MGNNTEAAVTFGARTELTGATRVEVQTRNFEFVIDEPESLGGTDEGPNPVEYLLGSLGGCLSIVAHGVADEMELELKDLTIDLEEDLDPAKFQGKDVDTRAGYQSIRASIDAELLSADGEPVDHEQKGEWLARTEDRCPVSDNLSSETPIEIGIA